MKRIGLFVDGSNMFEAARSLDFKIDYNKLLKYYQDKGDVVHAMYFTALPPKTVDSKMRSMTDWLGYNGYVLVTKETHDYVTSEGLHKLKGNMDVEIAVHAMERLNSISHLVLFSGDADFHVLVESAQRRGVHVTVVSSMHLVAGIMRKSASEFVDLATIKDKLTHQTQDTGLPARRHRFLNGG